MNVQAFGWGIAFATSGIHGTKPLTLLTLSWVVFLLFLLVLSGLTNPTEASVSMAKDAPHSHEIPDTGAMVPAATEKK